MATVALSLTRLQGTDPASASQLHFLGLLCLDISDVEIKELVFIHRAENTQWKGCRHKVPSSSALSASPLRCNVEKGPKHTQRSKTVAITHQSSRGEDYRSALLDDILRTLSPQELAALHERSIQVGFVVGV